MIKYILYYLLTKCSRIDILIFLFICRKLKTIEPCIIIIKPIYIT